MECDGPETAPSLHTKQAVSFKKPQTDRNRQVVAGVTRDGGQVVVGASTQQRNEENPRVMALVEMTPDSSDVF